MSTTSTMSAARPFTRPATNFTLLLLGIGAVMSSGCWPRQLVVWSPDGGRAVVMDANSTSLCDGEGKLARLDVGPAQAAAWMPDSKRVLLAISKSAGTWADLAKTLDEPTRQAVIAAADDFEKAMLAAPADATLTEDDAVEPIVKKVFENRGSLLTAALIYLRNAKPDALRKRLGEKWKELDKLSVGYTRLGLFELDGLSLKPATVILNSLKGIQELRLSPDGRAVAYVTGSDSEENSFTLWLVPMTAEATPRKLADRVAMFPDWSADGQHVAYVQASAGADSKSLRLGTLARSRVADANGALLAEPPDAEELAGLIFADTIIVRCLADGRILFSAAEVALPTTAADMPEQMSLFAIDPARPAVVTRMIPRQSEAQIPNRLLFELSPDRTHVSIAGSDAKVCVVSLADGKTTWVQQTEGKLRILPSWRSADELCFILPAAKNNPSARPEVALWSKGKTKLISKTWPDKVMKNLTFAPSQKQPPTTAPATKPGKADKGF